MHRLRALIIKEMVQMARDRRALVMNFVVPLILLLMFGYAVSFDIKQIRLGVRDLDDSFRSRELTRAFVASDYFRLASRPLGESDVERALDSGSAAAVLVIPRGFGRTVGREDPAAIQILLDGSDSSTATAIQGHARRIVQTYTASLLAERLRAAGVKPEGDLLPIDFRPRVLYNPELKSRNFMVPGLIGVLLTILGVLQTSMTIAREKDRGTLEQLRVTPLRAREILVGKVLPYALVAYANAWIALAVGRYLLGVPMRGSLWTFAAGTALFLGSALGIGLIISAVTSSQQGAQTAAFLGSVLPVFYLSDYMFPIRNMPAALQAVTYLVPARYYVTILRGTIQKGVGFSEMTGAFGALALYAAIIAALGLVAIRRVIR
jgi:ABC-2 type transport system permease protein